MTAQLSVLTQWFEGYKGTVDKSLRDSAKPWTKAFDLVEERTGVDRVKIFFGELTNWRSPVGIKGLSFAAP